VQGKRKTDRLLCLACRRYTYAQMKDEVSRLAGYLASQGVGKGDRVLIYMPMVPQVRVRTSEYAQCTVEGRARNTTGHHGLLLPNAAQCCQTRQSVLHPGTPIITGSGICVRSNTHTTPHPTPPHPTPSHPDEFTRPHSPPPCTSRLCSRCSPSPVWAPCTRSSSGASRRASCPCALMTPRPRSCSPPGRRLNVTSTLKES
jgi:hypothetical protein